MQANTAIQETWLRLLSNGDRSEGVRLEKLGDGYHAVVLHADPQGPNAPLCGRSDYQALESFIPNLGRTRAVYLKEGSAYDLPDVESLKNWAGDMGAAVESGAVRAFAVVDLQVFVDLLRAEFAGWSVEWAGHDLVVCEGRFKVRFNLLRSVVRMVFSRSTFVEAARSLRDAAQKQFALDQQLFVRFERRFEKYGPAVLDHFFTAYPEASCVAAGWDYWQVAEKSPAEAEPIFEEAMREFANVLESPGEGGMPWFEAGACEKSLIDN